MNKRLLIVVFSFFCYLLPAQEVLRSLTSDPSVHKSKTHLKKTGNKPIVDKPGKSLSLPFYDDFSNAKATDFLPDTAKWLDYSGVNVNNNYGFQPVTIGVATLNGIGSNGELYPQASSEKSFGADTLVSKRINLSKYHSYDSIYLSFFYQPGGYGEMPDSSDVLRLLFRTHSSQNWDTIWSVNGSALMQFKEVYIPIDDDKWLKDSFQFCLTNTASLNILSNDPGRNSDGDIWNIDYVYMGANRGINDSIFKDEIAVIEPPKSLLKNFESMPWFQFKIPNVRKDAMAPTISIPIISYRNTYTNIESDITISDGIVEFEPIISALVDSGKKKIYNLKEDFRPYRSDATDSVNFQIKLSLRVDDLDSSINNSITYYQHFSNYFAYDDGSAELGYGLSGEGTTNAMLALRFDTYSEDTLIGVQMFFNESLPLPDKDVLTTNFSLTIWNNLSNMPGDTLYKKTKNGDSFYRFKPDSSSHGWQTFLLDTAIIVPKVYYVGWVQKSPYFANLGFDCNRVAKQHTYFNLKGTPDGWKKSVFDGAIMIRPILKQAVIPTKTEVVETKISVFPNPTSENINFTLPDNLIDKPLNVRITTLMGTLCHIETTNSSKGVNVSQLPKGIYLVKITGAEGFEATTKFIKTAR